MVRDLSRRSSGPRRRAGAAECSASSAARSTSTRWSTRTLDAAGTMPGVDAVVVAVGAGRRGAHRRSRARGGRAAGAIAGPPDGSQPRSISVEYDYGPAERGRIVDPRRARGPALEPGEQLGYLSAYSRSGRACVRPVRRRGARGARLSAPARRSTTLAAFARPASWPISTRSPACTTAATSTRRSRARSPAPSATAAAWRSSSSTSTTSRRSTTGSATSPETASSPRRPTASATSSARPTSPAGSAATSSR